MKICSTCKIEKPLTDFDKDPRYKIGHRSQCVPCQRRGKRDSVLKWRLENIYGISFEEYHEQLAEQNNVCAICKLPETRITRPGGKFLSGEEPRLAVDHDHDTGKFRGLLCHKCNVGVGNFQDDETLLQSAIDYLRKVK